jgi:hypothetical protein
MPIAEGRKGAAKRPTANRVFYFSTHSVSYKQKHIIFFLSDIFSEKNNQISNTKRILTWLLTTDIKPKPGEDTNESKQKLKHLFVDSL